MMDDKWIVDLFARCEAAVGQELNQIRGNLSSKQWLGAIWELILLEAAASLGSVKYEPAAGSNHPDLLLNSHSGDRLYIEAAFLLEEKSDHARQIDDHLVLRALKEKGSKAKRADAVEPYVVFLGTDRVFDIASSRHTNGVAVEEAIIKAFGDYRSLSAVVLVSIFARFETFKPLQKRPYPRLYANPRARVPLTNKSVDVINRFDFERWPFDRFMRPNAKRPELRKALSSYSFACTQGAESGLFSTPPSPAAEPGAGTYPQDDRKLPYPCWVYIWRFNRLRITKIGNEYWLFRNREFLDVSAKTPGQIAREASQLFQIFLPHVMGPNGPEPHPDPGVPAELSKWVLELPDKSV
jgi:hypothetical protein